MEFGPNIYPIYSQTCKTKKNISFVISNGSVRASIDSGYLKIQDLLAYLIYSDVSNPNVISDDCLSAYTQICIYKYDQYMGNIHFCEIVNNEIYRMIYIECKCDLFLRSSTAGIILHFMTKALLLLREDSEECTKSKMSHLENIPKNSIPLAIRCCNSNVENNVEQIAKLCVFHDIGGYLETTDGYKYENYVLDKCLYLSSEHEEYWETTAKEIYKKLIYGVPGISMSTRASLSFIYGIGGFDLFTLKSMRYLCMDKNILSYSLGIKFDTGIPTEKVMVDAVKKLELLGIDKYTEEVKSLNISKYDPLSMFSHLGVKSVVCNNKYDIHSYNNSDLVYFCDGGIVYVFIREDFKKLIETNINPFSGKEFPYRIIIEMYKKVNSSHRMGLPECSSIRKLLDMVN